MINDVIFSKQFWVDWEGVPEKTRKTFNRLVESIALTGILPPSVNAHKVKHLPNLWIGYVSTGYYAWRFLYSVDSGVLSVDRLLSHNEMSVFLKKLI